MNFRQWILLSQIVIYLSSCATYYDKNAQLQSLITSGKFEEADKTLKKQTKEENGINRVLYDFNRGTTSFMIGNYEESNNYFQKADHYIEDYSSNVANEALALMTNPMIKPYRPEDFESVMIHYYMSLNYLFMNNYEDALVEARRLNLQLYRLNDRYKKNKNKYSEDAFAHNLMGIIYEASGDFNNAFIAYRNAVSAYENVYEKLWKQSIPEQLKKDVINAAYKTGFYDQVDFFERKFEMKYQPDTVDSKGSLVFFWMNGFGPVKSEWSINFTNTGYNDGWITLANDEEGLSFPIYIGSYPSSQQSAFKNLSFLRIAFPKYLTRKPVYNGANLIVNDTASVPLEMAENINNIAYECLQDRMVREFATSIARLATKKAMEQIARKENDNLGTIVSILNAVTEKADTRNWQSLPYSISYSRLYLPEGSHHIKLVPVGYSGQDINFDIEIKSGQTAFYSYHNIESFPPSNR